MEGVQIGDVVASALKQKDGPESQPINYKEYDPYKTPPDFDMAINHGKAKRVYRQKKKDDDHDHEQTHEMLVDKICPCCGLEIEGEELPLRSKLEDIYHLGSGFALYFKFTKYCIYIMGIIFGISGLYNIISNHLGDSCDSLDSGDTSESFCIKNFVVAGSLADKRNKEGLIRIQVILNMLVVIALILFLHYVRYKVRKTHIETDQKTVSPSDYTVLLKKVNANSTNQEIKEWLEGYGAEDFPVQVEKVVRAYDIRDYIALREQKAELQEKKDDEHQTNPQEINEELQKVKEKIKEYKVQGLKYTEEVFVTFTTADRILFLFISLLTSPIAEAAYIEQRLKKTFFKTFGRNLRGVANKVQFPGSVNVLAHRAPEPTDVLWENMGYTKEEKRRKKLITTFAAAIIIAAAFVLIVGMTWAQMMAVQKWTERTRVLSALALTVSLFVFVVNFILGNTIKFLADFEKHITITRYYTGIVEKLSVSMFINTTFTTIFAKMALGFIWYQAVGLRSYLKIINFYNTGGLLESIFYLVITGALVTPGLAIFDPGYFMQLFKRKQELKKGSTSELNQRDAHKLFEGPQFDIATKYANLVKTVLLVGFYAPALPSILVLAGIGLILSFWADKYILLRRVALPNTLDNDLTTLMIEYIEWTPLMYALGNLVFTYTMENSAMDPVYDTVELLLMWITLGLSIINVLVPMEYINQKIFKSRKQVTETLTYRQAQRTFFTDYDRENPITRKRALKEWMTQSLSPKKDQQVPAGSGFEMLVNHLASNILSAATNEIEKEKEKGEKEEHVTIEEEIEDYDLEYLNMYAAKVKHRPMKEIEEAPEEVATEYLSLNSANYPQKMEELGSSKNEIEGSVKDRTRDRKDSRISNFANEAEGSIPSRNRDRKDSRITNSDNVEDPENPAKPEEIKEKEEPEDDETKPLVIEIKE